MSHPPVLSRGRLLNQEQGEAVEGVASGKVAGSPTG